MSRRRKVLVCEVCGAPFTRVVDNRPLCDAHAPPLAPRDAFLQAVYPPPFKGDVPPRAWGAVLTLLFGESERGLAIAFDELEDVDEARAMVASAREVAVRLTALCDAATAVIDAKGR